MDIPEASVYRVRVGARVLRPPRLTQYGSGTDRSGPRTNLRWRVIVAASDPR